MICGLDEAGRGPVIGPLVVAGVKVEDDDELKELKVKDSKKLSPGRREKLEKKIKESSIHALRVVPAEEIDALRKEINLNQLEANVFASVIDELHESTMTIYVDAASTDEEQFSRMIETNSDNDLDLICRHAADESFPVVSAASILAKVRRDEEVQKIEAKIGREIGSGYPSDIRTRDFLRDWVQEYGELPPHTRRSWETARDVLRRAQTKTLDQF